MPTPKERLSHLLELAAQGPQQRSHLADEVADLLLDWPAQYSSAMRATFEALLEKIVREMEPGARAQLALRFAGRADVRLALLDEFFLAAPVAMKDAILARHDEVGPAAVTAIDGESLLAAARTGEDFATALARQASLPCGIAAEILTEGSGRALAVVARGGRLDRATYSAIVILAGPAQSESENCALLDVYDRVPVNGAAQLLAHWRGKLGRDAFAPASKAAE